MAVLEDDTVIIHNDSTTIMNDEKKKSKRGRRGGKNKNKQPKEENAAVDVAPIAKQQPVETLKHIAFKPSTHNATYNSSSSMDAFIMQVGEPDASTREYFQHIEKMLEQQEFANAQGTSSPE
jgi:hypothetical protein